MPVFQSGAGEGGPGGPPSGPAGGDLSGNYPNPSVDGMTAGVLTDDAAHGVRGGGTQHADAIAGGADGFMTGADKTKLDGVAANALANIVEDTTPQLGGNLDADQKTLLNVKEVHFDVQGASQGILYKDVGGGFRSVLIFPGSDLVVISNRASNGQVQVRANNVAAGVPGEQLVAVFAADRVILIQPTLIGAGGPQDLSSQLEIISTTKGFLAPRMTTAQRDAITTPAFSLLVANTTTSKLNYHDGTAWQALASESVAVTVVGEVFAATNARFFGELGLPATQGWTDTATGTTTIDLVNETVFGISKQVVRHNDNTAGGATTSLLVLTAQNWTDINAFGASYSGTSRLDTANGSLGFFSGLQANAAENPLATGNRRYGILFDSNGGNLRVTEPGGGTTVTFDGTGGNPQINFDSYVSWECVVPAGLGAAEFYINGVLTTFAPTFLTNTGGLGTRVLVGSGSTGGGNRVTYHSDFGVTIYEEASTKTLAAATMAADVAQVFTPEGKRDYTIILPDGNPRPVGAKLEVVASNLLGQLILVTQDPAIPEALFNGLRKLTLDIAFKEVVSGINTVANANVYIGFEVSV